MKELLPKGAIDKNKLPLFLTTWVDKTSQHCMFSQGQLQMWILPHLKAGSWYLDCGKGFCPEEEEELKNKLDAADIASGSTVGALQEGTGNADELDLSQMNEKDKKKVIAHRMADVEKAKKRLDKEAARVPEKSKKDATKSSKKGEKKSGKSTEGAASREEATPPAAENPRKRDSTFAGLSSSKLLQGTVNKLQDVGSANILMDELILNYFLLSIDQHSAQHDTFPKSWDDIIAFLEKVFVVLLFFNVNRDFLFELKFGCKNLIILTSNSYLIIMFCVSAQDKPPTKLLCGGQHGLRIGPDDS
jgi:hypothetical protein